MWKKIIGIICVVIGCLLFYYGYDITRQMNEARGKIAGSKSSPFIPKNPITGQIEKNIKEKYYQEVDSYQIYVTICYIGGTVFVAAGGIIFIWGFKKKK